MGTATISYRGLQTSIFTGAFVFGIVMSSLGSLLPGMSAAVGFEKLDAGRLFLLMNFGMLVGSLLFGPICDRFGFRALLATSIVMVGGSFATLAMAHAYGTILVVLAVLGLGGGALNGATNALINDISPDRRASALNRLGIFFGCGALFTPFLVGSLLEWAGLQKILVFLALLTLGPLVLFFLAHFPPPKHKEGIASGALGGLLGNPLLFMFAFLLFFQSGNEFTMGGWISTYLGEKMHFEPRNAAYVLAGYWGAIMAGRWLVSKVASRLAAHTLVIGSALLAMVAVTGLILTGSPYIAAVLVSFVGLGFAAIFPTTLAQAGTVFAEFSGTAFSVIFVVALAGGMTAPWLVGRVAQNHGVGGGFWITTVSCGGIIALQALIRILGRKKQASKTGGGTGI
jgi:MFS transporter, FHS family, glucose/mannose:H+ symporter